MADLALSNSLIDEYIKYIFQDEFDSSKIRKLLKFIQPFSLKSTHPIMSDPAMQMALENDPLIEIIDDCSDVILVQESLLKLMLIDNFFNVQYTTLNIMNSNEKLQLRYGGTYPNRMDKIKAQEHINALLSDAKWIKISDSYISSVSQWDENKNILETILPKLNIDITIESGSIRNNESPIDKNKQSELLSICSDWSVKARRYNDNILHDRYIQTDKFKILLSSGLYNLSSRSDKDFTYIVEITNKNL